MELWTFAQDGFDLHDTAKVAPFVGRGKQPVYAFTSAASKFRGPVADMLIPAGYNAEARTAATCGAIANKLCANPSSQVWQDTLLSVLSSEGKLP